MHRMTPAQVADRLNEWLASLEAPIRYHAEGYWIMARRLNHRFLCHQRLMVTQEYLEELRTFLSSIGITNPFFRADEVSFRSPSEIDITPECVGTFFNDWLSASNSIFTVEHRPGISGPQGQPIYLVRTMQDPNLDEEVRQIPSEEFIAELTYRAHSLGWNDVEFSEDNPNRFWEKKGD